MTGKSIRQTTNIMENIRHSVLPNTKQVVNLLYHMERDWKTAVDINEQLYGIVLVIGNPGCGKTTLIKHLIGDNEKLIADLSIDTKTYSFIDKNSLAGQKMFSTSDLPQIIEHQIELYIECPQFNDEVSLMSDVATSFAINSLIYNANSFKILFVCEHESMTAAAGYNKNAHSLCSQYHLLEYNQLTHKSKHLEPKIRQKFVVEHKAFSLLKI